MMDSYAMCNPLPRILVLPVILTALVAARGVLAQAAPGDPCGPTMFGYHLGNYLPNGYDNGNPGSATGQGVFHIHLGSPIPLLDGSLGGTAAGYLGSADYSSNILQPGGGPFLPPGSGIIGTFEGYPGGGGGGGGGPGGGPGDPGGGGPGGLGGGGGGFFDLGSLMFADASVQYGPNPTVSGSVMQYAATLPGEADVYTHEGSGDQIYEFIDAQGDPTGVSEIRHVDGTVIVLESYASPDPEVRTYRVKHIIDPFDNRVTYEYGAGEGGLGSGLLDRIHYPNGITEVWNWDPVWAQSSTYTGIEVTYLSAHPGINVADHTWAMVFEPTSEGNFPFAGGRLFRVYHPKSEYLQTPASGSLYDLTTTDAFVVYEFQANGQDPYHLVTDIYHARATTIDPDDPLPNRVQTLQVTYELTGTLNPQYRVKEQTLSQHPGATTTFAYEFHAGQTTDLVQFIDETSPVGTVTRTELDLEGRPVKITITPDSNSPLGVPRFLEQVPPSKGPDGEEPFSSVPWSSEPVSLTWQFEYGGCSVCAKPTRILDPLLRETLFSYWPTGLID